MNDNKSRTDSKEKNNSLEKWSPCRGYCQLAGAASAFLSIKGAAVIINGPRWCAVLAERELSACIKEYEKRLFCSEVLEFDLLYGIGKSLSNTLEEVQAELNPSLLGILTSCSMSLIGDDVQGICKSSELGCKQIALDAGGLTGEFWQGYGAAMNAIVAEAELVPEPETIKNRVNILGISACYPQWEGDLRELKRMLRAAGYEVGICLGENNLDLHSLAELPLAALNVVVSPELAENTAKYLEASLGQNYILASMPYGFKATIQWLEAIGEALGVSPRLEALEEEIAAANVDIAEELFTHKLQTTALHYSRTIVSAPASTAYGLAAALIEEAPNLTEVYLRVQGPDSIEKAAAPDFIHWQLASDLPKLVKGDFQVFLGTEREREELGDYAHTIYFNVAMPASRIKLANVGWAGIRGWINLVQNLLLQTRSLLLIENGGKL